MDPETQRLARPPRSLSRDAFFAADRSATTGTQAVSQFEIRARDPKEDLQQYENLVLEGQRDRPGVAATAVSFPVFFNKHAIATLVERNPLPHDRRTADGRFDRSILGWTHDATYRSFFNAAARALSGASTDPRLQVKLLFGTGSESYRHGVCGALEGATDPILLIDVDGVEPAYDYVFTDPVSSRQTPPLVANTRWGIGITSASIEKIIRQQYNRMIDYDIVACAAFSTGYLGLQGSVGASLFPIGQLARVVIYDCLYGSLKPALDRVKAVRPSAHVIAYVVTGAGNSFQRDVPKRFETLLLGGNRAWNYINLMGNVAFHAVTSSRVIDEGRPADALILSPLRANYEAALNGMVGILPARNTVISDRAIARNVKGSLPGGSTVLTTFASDKTNASRIRSFFQSSMVATTRHCLGRAQLLGWAAPPGEEWHDMLLIEFAWEYLT
jgi:hypothetical protein